MTCNNPCLDLFNMNAHIYSCENLQFVLKIFSGNKFWRKLWAITLLQNVPKMTCNNPNSDLVNNNALIKFNENLSISS